MAHKENHDDDREHPGATAEHYMAIGLFASNWSFLEANMNILIAKMCGIDLLDDLIVTAHLNTNVRIDILTSLSNKPQVRDELAADITDLVSQIRNIQAERNAIVHGTIAHSHEIGKLMALGFKARKEFSVRLMDIHDTEVIHKITRNIHNAIGLLSRVERKIDEQQKRNKENKISRLPAVLLT